VETAIRRNHMLMDARSAEISSAFMERRIAPSDTVTETCDFSLGSLPDSGESTVKSFCDSGVSNLNSAVCIISVMLYHDLEPIIDFLHTAETDSTFCILIEFYRQVWGHKFVQIFFACQESFIEFPGTF